MLLSSSSVDRRIPEQLSISRERNLTVEAPGWSALGPIGDGQPVQELSWLTAHGRAASVDTHESHCFCRMPPEFRLPSSEGEDKTRQLKASRNRNAISSIFIFASVLRRLTYTVPDKSGKGIRAAARGLSI